MTEIIFQRNDNFYRIEDKQPINHHWERVLVEQLTWDEEENDFRATENYETWAVKDIGQEYFKFVTEPTALYQIKELQKMIAKKAERIVDLETCIKLNDRTVGDLRKKVEEYCLEIEELKKGFDWRTLKDERDQKIIDLEREITDQEKANKDLQEKNYQLNFSLNKAQDFVNTAKKYLDNTLYKSVEVLNAGTHRRKDETMHQLQQSLVIAIRELQKDFKESEFDEF